MNLDREKLGKKNTNSKYRWDKIDEDMREYEETETDDLQEVRIEDCFDEDEGHFDEEADIIDEPEYPDISEKDLPKRVLAFSSIKLLKLFGKHLKSSLDGTFKSACLHWGQSFIWMVKYYGHWIPAVQAWLPDKTEESYKVKYCDLCANKYCCRCKVNMHASNHKN